MEHKLITGGEQWLPFARSRIKALRALGNPYACQRYEIDGAHVEIRIAGEHEYIRLDGGIQILSGVTRDSMLIVTPPYSPPALLPNYTLHSFKPTKKSEKLISFKPVPKDLTFNDEVRLGVLISAVVEPERTDESQHKYICGSMYSGRMAKLVQLLLGYGKMHTSTPYPNEDETPVRALGATPYSDALSGVRIRYDHRWACCHGVVTAQDDTLWLVEISELNGVIAMPLPMLSKTAAIKEVRKLFGGMPSGGTFPKNITKAIADGKVIRLASAASLLPLYSKQSYSSDMGWSFADNGRTAYNTCRGKHATEMNRFGTDKKLMAYLFRMDITISGTAGSATLVLQEEAWASVNKGPINIDKPFESMWSCPFVFQDSQYGAQYDPYYVSQPLWDIKVDENLIDPGGTLGFPIFVRHLNDVVDVVRVKSLLSGSGQPGIDCAEFKNTTVDYIEAEYEYGEPAAGNYFRFSKSAHRTGDGAYGGMWAFGSRDAFVVRRVGLSSMLVANQISGLLYSDYLAAGGTGSAYVNTFPVLEPNTSPVGVPAPGSLADAYGILHASLLGGGAVIDYWADPLTLYPADWFLALPTGAVKTKTLALEFPEPIGQRDARLTWRGDLNKSYNRVEDFPRFYLRHSVLGPSFHAVYSEDHVLLNWALGYGDQRFIGPLLEGEDPANQPFYSFVGYLT